MSSSRGRARSPPARCGPAGSSACLSPFLRSRGQPSALHLTCVFQPAFGVPLPFGQGASVDYAQGAGFANFGTFAGSGVSCCAQRMAGEARHWPFSRAGQGAQRRRASPGRPLGPAIWQRQRVSLTMDVLGHHKGQLPDRRIAAPRPGDARLFSSMANSGGLPSSDSFARKTRLLTSGRPSPGHRVSGAEHGRVPPRRHPQFQR
jgi:hypothetical protein